MTCRLIPAASRILGALAANALRNVRQVRSQTQALSGRRDTRRAFTRACVPPHGERNLVETQTALAEGRWESRALGGRGLG
ncbi:hypothetical protein KRM28CT15_69160 [Krasilnikovia sp. M28-CT-15]